MSRVLLRTVSAAVWALGTILLANSSASAQPVSGTEVGSAISSARAARNALDDFPLSSAGPTAEERLNFCVLLHDAQARENELASLYDRAKDAGQTDFASYIAKVGDSLDDAIEDGWDDIDSCFPPIFGLPPGAVSGPPTSEWWQNHFYLEVEAGGGVTNDLFGVTPGFNVKSGGVIGGGAVGWRGPVNSTPDSLINPVGVRLGVLGGGFNGSTFYPTDGFTYSEKMPLIFYGEAEFAYPTVDAIIRSVFPNSGIRIYSSAGFAGVVQTFSWSMPGVSGSTTTTGFGFTDGIRAEWPIYPGLDLFLQWRGLLITGQSVGIPGQVGISGWSNIVTAGIHKAF
jgi:hypothetical protein